MGTHAREEPVTPAFEDRSVIVTGGVRGIGRAIVEHFLGEGAKVTVFDLSPPGESEEPLDDAVELVTGDVADPDAAQRCVEQVVAARGRIDILVNNAGIIRDNVIWKMPPEDFDMVLAVNLKGPWLMCRAVAPIMRQQQSGRIINISSRSWLGNFGQSNYSASKGGLVSLTRVLALELARYHVTVNAVAPGLIDTPLTRSLPEKTREQLIAAQPGRRMGQPEDIAAAVAFLASDAAGFITGQVLHVDGGKSISTLAW